MKLLIFFAALCAFANGLTLREAFDVIFGEYELTLHSMDQTWNYYAGHYNGPCLLTQELATAWPAGFNRIFTDAAYTQLRNEIVAGGVAWDSFVDGYVRPAVGFHPSFAPGHSCATSTTHSVADLNRDLEYLFYSRMDHLKEAVEYSRAQSPAFADLYNRASQNTVAVRNMKCSTEIRAVDSVKTRHNAVGTDFFFELFAVLFGWPSNITC